MRITEFINLVDCSAITDGDGVIGTIIVNGYATNIGIANNYISHGDFKMTLSMIKHMSKEDGTEVYVV